MKLGKLLLFFALWGVIPVFAQRIDTIWVDSIPIEMVFVEGGKFMQGCMRTELESGECQSVNQPVHAVTLQSYYISKFEVTRELYRTVMGVDPSYGSFDYRPLFNITPKCPVQMVSWFDTQTFMDSLFIKTGRHFRLPTEAEWEYAARGGIHQDRFKYAGSDNLSEVAYIFTATNSNKQKSEVWCNPENAGKRRPNSLGLYNMTGNAAEWCSDWYSDTYYQTQTTFNDPTGPKEGTKKSCRGGGIGLVVGNIMDIRFRRGADPMRVHNGIGFRLAMDAEPVKY